MVTSKFEWLNELTRAQDSANGMGFDSFVSDIFADRLFDGPFEEQFELFL
jgi:hypothetical protein